MHNFWPCIHFYANCFNEGRKKCSTTLEFPTKCTFLIFLPPCFILSPEKKRKEKDRDHFLLFQKSSLFASGSSAAAVGQSSVELSHGPSLLTLFPAISEPTARKRFFFLGKFTWSSPLPLLLPRRRRPEAPRALWRHATIRL